MPGLDAGALGPLDETLAAYVDRGEVPGLVALVARGGDVHATVAGRLALEAGSPPVRRDSIFRIASISKPVTAVAALILAEEGTIELDERVDRLLPELADRRVLRAIDGPLDDTVPARRPITVRDLLAFTMGFGIVMAPPDSTPIQRASTELRLGQGLPSPQTPPDPDAWIANLGSLPLLAQPGEQWLYSTGSDVLGVLVARAASQPFEQVLAERLLEPLAMTDTGFSVPPGSVDRLVASYLVDFERGDLALYDPGPGGQWATPPAFPAGAAGLVSTADDLLAFARMLLAGGRHPGGRILREETVAAMTADALPAEVRARGGFTPDFFAAGSWGLGLYVGPGPGRLRGGSRQYGWDGGLGTTWRNDPDTELVGILLTQRAFTSPIAPAVCQDFWAGAHAAAAS